MASTHDHGIHDLAGITKLFEGNRIDTLIFNYGTSGPANYKLNKQSKHNLDEDESSQKNSKFVKKKHDFSD